MRRGEGTQVAEENGVGGCRRPLTTAATFNQGSAHHHHHIVDHDDDADDDGNVSKVMMTFLNFHSGLTSPLYGLLCNSDQNLQHCKHFCHQNSKCHEKGKT